jgi:hypothetical protein
VLDCEVLALVALELASVRKEYLGQLAQRLGRQAPPPAPAAPAESLAQKRTRELRQGPKKRSWIDGWKG